MTRPGPKPAPAALKVVRGDRADRIPLSPPAPAGKLQRPGWLLPEAKRLWTRLVPQLERWGLGAVDQPALALLCQSWAHYVECQRAIAEHGTTFVTEKGYITQRPEVGMANRHLEAVRKLCAEFGLTLSARGRIAVPTGAPDDGPARFLN